MKGGRDLRLYNSSLATDHGSSPSFLRYLFEQRLKTCFSLRGVDVFTDSPDHSSAMKGH